MCIGLQIDSGFLLAMSSVIVTKLPCFQVRVFTYMIGREIGDPRQVKWMACSNKGTAFYILSQKIRHAHFASELSQMPINFNNSFIVAYSDELQKKIE